MAEIVSGSETGRALVSKEFLSGSGENEHLSGCSRGLRQVSTCGLRMIDKHEE